MVYCAAGIVHDKHMLAIYNAKRKTAQVLIGRSVSVTTTAYCALFAKLLCQLILFMESNEQFKDFLDRNTGRSIPLNKNYLSVWYDDTLTRIRDRVHGKKVFFIDESADVVTRCIANVIVRILEIERPDTTFLLTTEIFESANHSNGKCRRLHNEELHILYRSPNIW